VGDRDWFDALYRDLDDGGTSQFLWLLQNLKLGDWHPRITIKTEETAEQQRMSGDSVLQWAQACIDADAIIGLEKHHPDLGNLISFPVLLDAYSGFCKRLGERAANSVVFGKACTDMFGPKSRLSASSGIGPRPSGYHVPTAVNWQREVDKRLGLK
jgi:hypothetical protein